MSHEKISGKPLLLLANKQDNENALDELDLIESLELERLVNKERCPTLVESCSATITSNKSQLDPSIKKGYNWLLNYIIREYDGLNARVKRDVEQQEIIEEQARQDILRRFHMLDEVERQKRDDDIIELFSDYNMKVNDFINQKNSRSNSEDTSSAYSSESLPPIYYGTINGIKLGERPKSSTQIIKEQLEHEYNHNRLFTKNPSNKTEPINLLGVKLPHSAQNPRTAQYSDRRSLKSAGDSVFVVSNMPNTVLHNVGGDGDLHRQLFEMTTIAKDSPRLNRNNDAAVPKRR